MHVSLEYKMRVSLVYSVNMGLVYGMHMSFVHRLYLSLVLGDPIRKHLHTCERNLRSWTGNGKQRLCTSE